MVVVRVSQSKNSNNAGGKNQHLSCPPESMLRPIITTYFTMGISDVEIVKLAGLHFDKRQYGLSLSTVKRRRKQWGLASTREQNCTKESIAPFIQEIRDRFPFKGAEGMRKTLMLTYKMHVSRALISEYLKEIEPSGVRARRQPSRFKRRRFYAAGVNDVWAQDQHDKWGKKYGLWFHLNLDPFSGKFNWLKVWWTNSNPRLITKYYLDACRKIGGIPVLTQSDPGTENNGVANVHTTIRHTLDLSLSDTLQHRFCRKTQNIKPEAAWSIFCRDFVPGFEAILDQGIMTDIYDPDNALQNLIFRWLAIPWIQAELDDWVYERNHSRVRADKNKVLPHGIPSIIAAHPEHYGALDFKISVNEDLFDAMEAMYAPLDHTVFELVPKAFDDRAVSYYNNIGQPAVSFANFWDIYSAIFAEFQRHDESQVEFSSMLYTQGSVEHTISSEILDILPGMKQYSLAENRQTIDNPETVDGAVMEYLSDDKDGYTSTDNNHTMVVELTTTIGTDDGTADD